LVSRLVARYRKRRLRVGVVAVDPTSPFSGGAILGDRIRMQEHTEDPEVFVRSLATRGAHGGLSHACEDVVLALGLWGARVVLLETVGVGQAELDVMQLSDTVVVVVAPGMGDDVQAAKAGILEIGDVLVVNKSDRPEAARTLTDLQGMLALSRVSASSSAVRGHTGHSSIDATSALDAGGFVPALHAVTAETGEGVDDVLASIDAHAGWLEGPAGQARLRDRRRQLVASRLSQTLERAFERSGRTLVELAGDVVDGKRTLGEAASEVERRVVKA
jgi:LAO/AO transport system kinase